MTPRRRNPQGDKDLQRRPRARAGSAQEANDGGANTRSERRVLGARPDRLLPRAVRPHLPYGRQWVDEADVEAVTAVLRSNFLTTGPVVGRFQDELARTCGVRHCVGVNSGTAALHSAYFAAGLGPGDEIVTSPLTFAATANAARYLGAEVRFVDVRPETGNLDPGLLAQAITPRTRLIVPVDYAGHPADYDEIGEVARRHGLTVVADAAHSLGATYGGRRVGSLADLTATSFHPVKPITTAEGGAVLTDSDALAGRALRFLNHGIERDRGGGDELAGPWYYEIRDLGYNYRLSDVHCALGLSQLPRLGSFIARRREIARRYGEGLGDLEELVLPTVGPEVESGWHLYVVQVPQERRKLFFERLRGLGIGVQVHYIPVYYHPYYQELGYAKGLCPAAEERYARSVSLPIFPAMTDDDVEHTIRTVRQTVRETL